MEVCVYILFLKYVFKVNYCFNLIMLYISSFTGYIFNSCCAIFQYTADVSENKKAQITHDLSTLSSRQSTPI
jgi:hypothetical protein